ncbi:3-isopropylmalate dehydratase small subunit [Sphingobium sufflavum]|uniref:3-isopropylmalate dehydratase small subunit n=1 Tax=Sphingobium sufflavum TaxID=1129547 RepID=UPI001F4274D9|nr:3-isopropylmalate dehydratase small subunit [Sphingobium sufflavum]MCE7796468.1 3-isopropylmalate dehydratase small subunit [Sphingobium sufflavum]
MTLIRVEGRAYPLGRANVDTDMIIASEWLKTISREGLGKGAFAALRHDPANVFDDPAFAGAAILIAGENFGCGSSREHAAWAMADMGVRVVIAVSLSDIFASNAFKNGVLAVCLPADAVAHLLDAVRGGAGIAVDLEAQAVRCGGRTFAFAIDAFRRRCLMEGLDEIALTLADAEGIAAHEGRVAVDAPWLAMAGRRA